MKDFEREIGYSPERELQVLGLSEVQSLVEQGYSVVPLVEKMRLRESAEVVYERLRGQGPSFMLESADPAEHQGRYSFIGTKPEKVILLENGQMSVNGEPQEFDDPYQFVDSLVCGEKVAPVVDLPTFYGGAAGLFGYDLARYREPTIGQSPHPSLGLPDMALIVPGVTVAFDHYAGEVSIIKNITIDGASATDELAAQYDQAVHSILSIKDRVCQPDESTRAVAQTNTQPTFSSNTTESDFMDGVERAKEHIDAGDAFQIVTSQRFSSESAVGPDFAYKTFNTLKRLNPSRYGFIFEFDDFQATGCSPETLVKVTDGRVEHMAIAGTRKRGGSADADEELAEDLATDAKELAEHYMLVDLSRNDVGKVCEPESVAVTRHAAVENYSHVMHMTSEIDGQLRAGYSALDALASISPPGTLSGAPKISAMQIIDTLENTKRGFYGGAAGYVTPGGNLDSCIFIRSIVVDREGVVHVQAGAGVVADSDSQSEYQETIIKAGAQMQAISDTCSPPIKRQQVRAEMGSSNGRAARMRRLGSKVVLLDNYDSYTYNVVQFLSKLGANVEVMRNDVSASELIATKPDFLVVSPGPHTPKEAGLSTGAMRYFPEKGVPSLGICLGHQALAVAFGGKVERYKPVHGKTSEIRHDGKTIFSGLPDKLEVMRYHSLIATNPLPDALERSAYLVEPGGQEVVMAMRHKVLPAEGVQFHPESFYTPSGMDMLRNFLKISANTHAKPKAQL